MKTTNQKNRSALFWSCMALIATVAMQLTVAAQTLVNRYSFTDDGTGTNVVDSVGGTAWYGILPNGGDFATFPGQLLLSASSAQYVQLPVGILSNYTAVTIDVWATFGALPANCFLYGFGDTDPTVLTGGLPSGFNYIFCQPQNGRIAITAADPGYTGEQGCNGAGNLSTLTVHVTSVYNPVAGYIELYKNGVLVGVNNSVTVQMNQVSNQLNYIAKSLYDTDSYMDVELNEFRIWNGALNALQVAGCDVAGPDTVGSAADAGTVTNIQLSIVQFQLVQGTHEAGVVMAQTTAVPYPIDITRLATLTSGNTNILTITNGVIYAVGQGSAIVIASYASLTNSQIITVVQPASALTHRYSFNDAPGSTNVADSVGGAGWDGILMGSAFLTNGQVALPNTNSTGVALDYVKLPVGILTNASGIGTNFNNPAVTIETWATISPGQYTWANLFDFGMQDGAGQAAYDVHVCVHNNGNATVMAIADSDNANGHNQGYTGPAGSSLDGQTNLEIAAVFNPPAGYLAIYTNGVLMGRNTGITITMAGVYAVLNKVGADNWPDLGMKGLVDEVRIYNGALTSQGIAISAAAGPDSIPATVTNGPGALLSLSIQAPAVLESVQQGSLKLLANYAGLSNWDLIANSVFPPAGLTISVSDTNVLAYANGILTGVNPGTASVTAIYQGITNSVSVTVVQAAAPTLVHRYSFGDANGSTNVVDSIGGPVWNGMVMTNDFSTNAGVIAPGSFTGTQLQLTASSLNFVQLPSGILSNYTAMTIEGWVTAQTLPANCMYYAFGGTETNGLGTNYIFGSLVRDYTAITAVNPGYLGEQGTAGGRPSLPLNTAIHFVAVYDSPAGYIALYTNGVLVSVNGAVTDPLSVVSPVKAYIGRSLYNGDPYASITLDEFRIYNGVLSPRDITATQVLGPDQLLASNVSLSAAASGGNLVLSWPVGAGAYTLQSKASLTPGAWTTISTPAAQLVGSQWQVTVPNTGGAKFFRLVR